jgi:signal transduction histidine kinase
MPCVARLRDLAARGGADLLVAALLLGWGLADVPWPWRPPGHGGAAAAVCGFLVLALVQSVPSLWRRRVPVTGLALACGALVIRTVLGLQTVSGLVAVAATGYAAGAYSDLARRHVRPLVVVSAVSAVVAAVEHPVRAGIGMPAVLLGAALVAGDAAASRRRAAQALVEAAQASERTRIARELHDVLAHQLSAIAVHAGAVRMATAGGAGPPAAHDAAGQDDASTARAREALATVEALAREALVELGHMLGVLRRDPDARAARRPAPCVAEMPSLVSTARAAGVSAELTVVGPRRPLSPGAELAAYRIVQEALTNVVKHAPGAAAEVVLRFLPEALELTVADGGAAHPRPERPPAQGGRGMLGMRERAELHGGTLTVTTPAAGGFAVRATLPYACTGGTS